MPTYQITEVSEDYKEWDSRFGPMHTYTVKATDPAGESRVFEMNRKPQSGPPQTGEVDASEQPAKGDFPPKLKINYSEQGGGGGSSTSGGMSKDDYWRRKEERDLTADKRMGRAHAQEMALRLIDAAGDAGDLRMDDDAVLTSYLNGPVKRLTDWFAKDVDAAGEGE
jgi:hypothetical protein